jgi:MFS family permease
VGLVLGLYRSVACLSLLIGPLTALLLIELWGFAICFIATSAAMLLSLTLVLLTSTPGKTGDNSTRPSFLKTLGLWRDTLVDDKPFMLMLLSITLIVALGYGLLSSFVVITMAAIDSSVNAGLYFTAMGLGGLAMSPAIGKLSDMIDQSTLSFICMGVSGLGIAILALLNISSTAFYISGVLSGLGYYGTTTALLALIAARVSTKHRTSVISLQQNGIDFGIAVSGILFGAIFALTTDDLAVYGLTGCTILLIALLALVIFRINAKACRR